MSSMGRQTLLATGMRGRIITLRDDLWKGKPYKPLTFGKRSTGGRNNTGRSDDRTTAPSPFTIGGVEEFQRCMCAAHVASCERLSPATFICRFLKLWCVLPHRITAWHRGGGHKRLLRTIEFKGVRKGSQPGVVQRIEYDPNRSARIALVKYGECALPYPMAPHPNGIYCH